jgi:hypothetical protein
VASPIRPLVRRNAPGTLPLDLPPLAAAHAAAFTLCPSTYMHMRMRGEMWWVAPSAGNVALMGIGRLPCAGGSPCGIAGRCSRYNKAPKPKRDWYKNNPPPGAWSTEQEALEKSAYQCQQLEYAVGGACTCLWPALPILSANPSLPSLLRDWFESPPRALACTTDVLSRATALRIVAHECISRVAAVRCDGWSSGSQQHACEWSPMHEDVAVGLCARLVGTESLLNEECFTRQGAYLPHEVSCRWPNILSLHSIKNGSVQMRWYSYFQHADEDGARMRSYQGRPWFKTR